MPEPSELAQALGPVVEELSRLNVRYYIGGSVAGWIHGAIRSTDDVDVAAELDEGTALQLTAALQGEFYVNQTTALDAVRRRACFHLIHLATSFKIGVFVSQDRAFDRSVQERAITSDFGDADSLSVRFATAEDIILLKLAWYRLGQEASERQWSDLTRIAKIHGHQLDEQYLQHWTAELSVADLLDRLLAEIR